MGRSDQDAITRDAFLGGRLHLLQPAQGYRAGLDAVLLSACVQAEKGQRVLELGCGVGAAILCLGCRVPGLELTGIEREAGYAALARQNGGAALEVVEADLTDLPLPLRQRQFDHVLANPPYFDRRASVASDDPAREAAHGAQTPLAKWVKTAAKRLAPKGYAHFIHLTEHLPEILAALPHEMGSVEVLPLAARAGRAPDRFILRARKNGRGAFKLNAPLIMHQGARHVEDGDTYVPVVRAALRDGAALVF
ncbi:methyltransferase [Sulfitobacter sp. M57]|uniref:tRNA1(Val) (adenine(37)-N6)-methyltransferase n=1 Tax=unclassified Sulfitobacter TaxID=196795 RepID=UPI0023E26A43|nr:MULTISPECIES: methyltransferase domain-containing protein [unclassified Sulfitobacter]MDF3415569.1 methyltransferase [Sulfitobacter sp. KE5]MDF3423050.1 methyltransferase [Sulfitobacter sp. KE43]MDF3434115.1 methyltransferase [Sulfitobacter sp. KE42]MDF3459852.1 methyltransferase [Sulfitobacter sp. S74]MDF3463654.1 methyltransferase [Sulfitobacter sp. Ks18]